MWQDAGLSLFGTIESLCAAHGVAFSVVGVARGIRPERDNTVSARQGGAEAPANQGLRYNPSPVREWMDVGRRVVSVHGGKRSGKEERLSIAP